MPVCRAKLGNAFAPPLKNKPAPSAAVARPTLPTLGRLPAPWRRAKYPLEGAILFFRCMSFMATNIRGDAQLTNGLKPPCIGGEHCMSRNYAAIACVEMQHTHRCDAI